MFKIFSLVLCLFCLYSKLNGQFLGTDPVKFTIESLTSCADDAIWSWNINLRNINDTFVSLSANFTIDRDFDDKVAFSAEFYQFNSKKKWKRFGKLAKKNSCSFLKNLAGPLFVEVVHELGIASGNCPVAKGSYKLDDRLIDVQSTPLAKFLVGRFKGIISGFSPQKETLFCGELIFVTTKIKI